MFVKCESLGQVDFKCPFDRFIKTFYQKKNIFIFTGGTFLEEARYGSVLLVSNGVVYIEQINSMKLGMMFFLWTAQSPAPNITDG